MRIKKLLFTLTLVLAVAAVTAQDFDSRISVNASQVPNVNQTKINALQQALHSFINDRKWCNYQLTNQERIECMLQINLKTVTGDQFEGTMTIQLQRPVYKTNYKTTVLNFQDHDISFSYGEGQTLEYAENATLSQFTSLIAFYLNLFLGCDFDTFSLNGGTPYFDKCLSIVSLNSTAKGWTSSDMGMDNRYYIMENMTNSAYAKLREFLYSYHRLGLDIMQESPDQGRAAILDAMKLLQQANQVKSNIFMVQVFVQAKADEIVSIFKEATPTEKSQILAVMRQLDPSNVNKYNAINQSNPNTPK
jgi:hypothetical protein